LIIQIRKFEFELKGGEIDKSNLIIRL